MAKAKPRVEDCPALDVRHLRREQLLKPGTQTAFGWVDHAHIIGGARLHVAERSLRLEYILWPSLPVARRIVTDVSIVMTPLEFGGEREWFVCPGDGCDQRVAILYLAGDEFLCRRCSGLAYESQLRDPIFRSIYRSKRLQARLGGTGDVTKPIPERPKGMHLRTYLRLVAALVATHEQQTAMISSGIDKSMRLLDRRLRIYMGTTTRAGKS